MPTAVNLAGFHEVPFVELPFTDFAGDVGLRWQRMNGVLQAIIDGYENTAILDVASGGGHDSIYLAKQGYNVTANEVDAAFARRLHDQADAAGVELPVIGVDWREFSESPGLENESFDVLFALGNSFPNYLFEAEEREVALRGFWRVLKPGGTLFFDTRNYDYILTNAEKLLRDPEHNFAYAYANTYMNRKIACFPTVITPDLVRLSYKHYGTRNTGGLDLWPATQERVTTMVEETLGDPKLKTYYDYRPEPKGHYDFLQYAITKPALGLLEDD